MGTELSFTDKVKKEIVDHKTELEVAGVIAVTAAALILSRGKARPLLAAIRGGSEVLPEVSLIGNAALRVAPEGQAATEGLLSLSATRPQTVIESLTEKSLRMGVSSAKIVLNAIRSKEVPTTLLADAAEVPNDAVRRHVFNRFLSRLDQGDYVLHGSYALENQIGSGARKALKDLDLLATNPALVKGSRDQITTSLVTDLQRSVSRPMGDGLTFDISEERTISDRIFPRMRHLVASAKADGQEVMRIPLDVRVGAKTILEPESLALTHTHGGVGFETTVAAMQKEETLAYKLFTYGNRYVGGLVRKPKDLNDMATIIKGGVEAPKVAEALQAWTTRGFNMGPVRPVEDILGASYNASPALKQQAAANFQVVKGFYQDIATQVENVDLRPEVSNNWLAQTSRFLKKHYVIYPAELKPAGTL